MKRSGGMKRTGSLKRGDSLRRVSRKREQQLREESKVKQAALARDRGCRAKELWPEVQCRGPLDKHELVKRSAWPKGALVLDNVIIVCRAHHDAIEDSPQRAHERGLALFSWEMGR